MVSPKYLNDYHGLVGPKLFSSVGTKSPQLGNY